MNRRELETAIPNLILSGTQSEWTLQKIWENIHGKRNLVLDVLHSLTRKGELKKHKIGRKIEYTIPETDPVQWQDLRISIGYCKKECKQGIKELRKHKPIFKPNKTVNPKSKKVLEYLSYEFDSLMVMYTRLSYALFLNLADKKYEKIIQKERKDIEEIMKNTWGDLVKEGKSFEPLLKRFFGMRRRNTPFSIYPLQ